MSANLTEPLEAWLNPVYYMPIIVVIIGAFFTYLYAIRLEDRRNRYNLKVKIYIEILDQLMLLRSYNDNINALMRHSKNDALNEAILDKRKKADMVYKSLFQHIAKIQIVCNREVAMSFADFYNYLREPEIDMSIFVDKMSKLTKAMRIDLGGKETELDWLIPPEETSKTAMESS
jgi:hypothetical protein